MTDTPRTPAAHTSIVFEASEARAAFRLAALRPVRDESGIKRALDDQVAFLTALGGLRGGSFALQLLAHPDTAMRERGRIEVALLAKFGGDIAAEEDLLMEALDDVDDLLRALQGWCTWEPVGDPDEVRRLWAPLDTTHLAQILRREEPLDLPSGFKRMGFNRTLEDLPDRTPDLWQLWTFPVSPDGRERLASLLLSQEAPVCLRTILVPTSLSPSEEEGLDDLEQRLASRVGGGSLAETSLRTLRWIALRRPLFEMQLIVTSPERLSPALVAGLGHVVSPSDAGAPDRAVSLSGSYLSHRPHGSDETAALRTAFEELLPDDGLPSIAPEGLQRIRRLFGPWEASAAFRFPVARERWFPGIEVVQLPDLKAPVVGAGDDGVEIGDALSYSGSRSLGIAHEDRFRHAYVVGQTGTGKSTLLLRMIVQDLESGAGVGVIDPHGDLIDAVLRYIPDGREDDVVLIDPADPEAVVGLNVMEADDAVQRQYIVSDLCDWFQQLYDPGQTGIVGPRFETWFRYAALTLMLADDAATLLEVPRLFVDDRFLLRCLQSVDDPMVKEFWFGEMGQTSAFHKGEVLGWFRSKFEPFRTTPLVRNVVGQPHSTVSLGDAIDTQKIVLAKLSKGLLGEYNSALLAFVLFAKIWAATLTRASVPPDQRPDFFLYADEFHALTTEALPSILSEARKFRLGLTMANQFFSQIPSTIREAIMGNVGSRIAFRLGPLDAPLFSHWLGPEVGTQELTDLPNFHALASVQRDGRQLDTAVIGTRPMEAPHGGDERAKRAIEASRRQWARPLPDVEREIHRRWQEEADADDSA